MSSRFETQVRELVVQMRRQPPLARRGAVRAIAPAIPLVASVVESVGVINATVASVPTPQIINPPAALVPGTFTPPRVQEVLIYTRYNTSSRGGLSLCLVAALLSIMLTCYNWHFVYGSLAFAFFAFTLWVIARVRFWWGDTRYIGMLDRSISDDYGTPTRSLFDPFTWASNVAPLPGYTGYRLAPVFVDIAFEVYQQHRGGSKFRPDLRRFITNDLCRALSGVTPALVPNYHIIAHNTGDYLAQRIQIDCHLNPSVEQVPVHVPY